MRFWKVRQIKLEKGNSSIWKVLKYVAGGEGFRRSVGPIV
jgi:hypothetical protein